MESDSYAHIPPEIMKLTHNIKSTWPAQTQLSRSQCKLHFTNLLWGSYWVYRAGADPGGGGSWGSGPPPPFWWTPKLHKEGKNVARVRAKTPHFSTLQLPRPPPLSEILYPPLQGFALGAHGFIDTNMLV